MTYPVRYVPRGTRRTLGAGCRLRAAAGSASRRGGSNYDTSAQRPPTRVRPRTPAGSALGVRPRPRMVPSFLPASPLLARVGTGRPPNRCDRGMASFTTIPRRKSTLSKSVLRNLCRTRLVERMEQGVRMGKKRTGRLGVGRGGGRTRGVGGSGSTGTRRNRRERLMRPSSGSTGTVRGAPSDSGGMALWRGAERAGDSETLGKEQIVGSPPAGGGTKKNRGINRGLFGAKSGKMTCFRGPL